jgi:hypothetical protein
MRSRSGAGMVSRVLAVQTKRTRERSMGTSMLGDGQLSGREKRGEGREEREEGVRGKVKRREGEGEEERRGKEGMEPREASRRGTGNRAKGKEREGTH